MISYTFDQVCQVSNSINKYNNHLVLIAGASASGKSYIAEELVKQLTESGKKVLLISSDNYYSNESSLKYLLYGTFDHPGMIDYDLLANNIIEYFETGHTNIPSYSFIEKRRTHLTPIDDHYDTLIVEGLYTINQLNNRLINHIPPQDITKIFVHADLEEIIFRRIVRDQKRVAEPLHIIIDVMARVFPMRNIFGQTQLSQSDIMIENTFQIMDKEGKKSHRQKVAPSLHTDLSHHHSTSNENIEYITDYVYNDPSNDDDCVIISEVYDAPQGLLRKVTITKRKLDIDSNHEQNYESISLDLYQPGIITSLHTLMQLAGLKFVESYAKKIYYYTTAQQKIRTLKEKVGSFYELLN